MAKCGIVHTVHTFGRKNKEVVNVSSFVLEEEGTPLNSEEGCQLHAFLLANGFMYVPSGFFIFSEKGSMLQSTALVITMAAGSDCVIRVLPDGYKPCLKSSRRYAQLKKLQPSRHVVVADIVCGHWKLKGRREVLGFTIDMLDGGVYDTEGVMVNEYASMFMSEHFDVKN